MRKWRKWIGKFIPLGIKRWIVARNHGYRPSQVPIPFKVIDGPAGRTAVFENGTSIKVTESEPLALLAAPSMGEAVEELAAFLAEVPHAAVLFDVGAHTGAFALVFCAGGSEKRAFAYEPSPPLASTAEELARINVMADRLTVIRAAVAAVAEERWATLGGGSFINLGCDPSAPGAFAVPIVRLDDECARLGVFPELVKVDVEGYEYEVLRGAERLLRESKPTLFLELHLDVLEQRNVPIPQICGLLAQYGYVLFDLVGNQLSTTRLARSIKSVIRVIARPAGTSTPS